MRAGTLRHEVSIQAPTTSKDADSAPTRTWATISGGEVRAAIRHLSASELVEAQRDTPRLSTEITVRYSSDLASVDNTHRILHGADAYALIGPPINRMERDRTLVFMCEKGLKDA